MSQPICTLDLRGVACPMNWVKTKLQLEEIAPGESLAILLDEGQPLRNVPRSAEEDGHTVAAPTLLPDGGYRLVICKGA